MTDRSLPRNLEAEKSVLGAVLINNDLFGVAAEVVDSLDFFRDAHRRIWEKMVTLTDRSEPVDLVTLKAELAQSAELDEVGGPAYISALSDGVPRSANVEYYAKIVKEKSTLRRLIQASSDVLVRAYDAEEPSDNLLDEAERAIFRIADSTSAARSKRPLLVDDVAVLQSTEPRILVEGMIYERTIYGIVGPQGCGKTTVALGLAYGISATGEFLGCKAPTRGATVYVLLEGQTMARRRILAAKLANGLAVDEPTGVYLFLDALDLLDPRSVTRFIGAARAVAPVNVVIDTWAMAFTGDENSSQEVGRGLRACQRIRHELGAAVGLIHHTNATATRERGSTAFKAGIDTMLMLTVADDALRLACEKQRDDAQFSEIQIRLEPVPGAGAQVVRLASDVLPTMELTTTQARALTRLAEDFISGATSAEWKSTVPEIPDRTFYRVTSELVRRGYVDCEGKGRHVRYRAVRRSLP